MVLAAEFSAQLGMISEADAARVERHLASVGLPTHLQDIAGFAQEGLTDADALMALMAQDKKVKRGKTDLHPAGGGWPRGGRQRRRTGAGARFPATEVVGMRTGLQGRGGAQASRGSLHEARMSSTAFNLLLAFSCSLPMRFTSPPSLRWSRARGFRIKAMVEQDRFGARLLQDMMGNIEAYLACCQLGITMASLGLGWVGEPTVSALLEPVLIPFGFPNALCTLWRSRAFWCSPRCTS